MGSNSDSLFRQKSLDNLGEKPDLKKGIKIATPGVVVVIVAICIIVAGFFEWCTLYEIETTQKVLLVKDESHQTKCIIRTEFPEYWKINKYRKLYYNDGDYTLNISDDQVEYNFIKFTDNSDDAITMAIIDQELNYKDGEKYYICSVDGLDLPSNSDVGYAVVKRENPISYLLNYSWSEDSEL